MREELATMAQAEAEAAEAVLGQLALLPLAVKQVSHLFTVVLMTICWLAAAEKVQIAPIRQVTPNMAAAVEVLVMTQCQAAVVLCMVGAVVLAVVHILRTPLTVALGGHTPTAQVRAAMAPMVHREHLAQAMEEQAAAGDLTSLAVTAEHHLEEEAAVRLVHLFKIQMEAMEDVAKLGFGPFR